MSAQIPAISETIVEFHELNAVSFPEVQLVVTSGVEIVYDDEHIARAQLGPLVVGRKWCRHVVGPGGGESKRRTCGMRKVFYMWIDGGRGEAGMVGRICMVEAGGKSRESRCRMVVEVGW